MDSYYIIFVAMVILILMVSAAWIFEDKARRRLEAEIDELDVALAEKSILLDDANRLKNTYFNQLSKLKTEMERSENAIDDGKRYHCCRSSEPIILDKEDWTPTEWKIIEKLLAQPGTERIVLRECVLEWFA